MSDKWAVVVVHGVGFRKPGETVENFYRVVSEQRGLFDVGSPQIRQLDCEETTPFPMYLRNAETGKQEPTVFAEVYWGDLSKSGSSFGHLMLRMLTIVFHLRYLIDCAAAHPQANWLAKFQRLILWLASMILCGPIAATYLMLIVFVFLEFCVVTINWLIPTLFLPTEKTAEPMAWFSTYQLITFSSIATVIGICSMIASVKRKLTWGGTWLYLLGWFTAFAIIILVYSICCLFCNEQQAHIEEVMHKWIHIADWAYVSTIGLMLTAILVAIVLVAWDYENRLPYVAAVGASLFQLGLWSVIVPTITMLLFHLPHVDDSKLWAEHRNLCLTNWLFASIPIAVLILVGIFRVFTFRVGRSRTAGRLIVHWSTFFAIMIAAILGGLCYLNDFLVRSDMEFAALVPGGVNALSKVSESSWLQPITGLLQADIAKFGVVLFMVLLVIFFAFVGRTILHVAMDVIGHFYRPKLYPMRRIEYNSHTLQQCMTGRMHRVLKEMRDEGVTRVTIVSHSQGTSVAVIALARLSSDAKRNSYHRPTNLAAELYDWMKSIQVDLVTMGSPIGHLYQCYFPDRYPPFYRLEGPLLKWNKDWGSWGDKSKPKECFVHSWLNLYRIDDFVGTSIIGNGAFPNGFPRNVELNDLGGHMRYWNSIDVVKELDSVLPGKQRT